MPTLAKPDIPPGPLHALFERLHDLHHEAGWPSLRTIAREVRCSHVTVGAVFSGPRAPRWGLLELVVEALGGDVEVFRTLWLDATSQEPGAKPTLGTGPIPRELPADVVGFTGRRDAVSELDRLLDRGGTGMRIVTISGTPGVGKTALAVHWAHRVSRRFPDGQLFVDLRGYDPGTPVTPAEVLSGFLRSLGGSGTALPAAVAELAARYRTLIVGRRMLVVLDNASSVEQVRDLLPGTASCFVLVTSRDALPGLVARHGALRVELDLLTTAEASRLLAALIGTRAETASDDVLAMASHCAYLPLALRVAAELAVSRPAATLAELAAELANHPGRLDALDAGNDETTAVRTVFSWSIRQLSPSRRRMFDLLGLYPGPDIDATAAAALGDISPADARQELSTLHRAHLMSASANGRYGMHDLLRAYAAERAMDLPETDQTAALVRLRDYHRRTAVTAVALKFGAGDGSGDLASAAAWLDAERSSLVAVALGSVGDNACHVAEMSGILAPYLDACGHYVDAIAVHTAAASITATTGDIAAAGAALNRLGAVHARSGDLSNAIDRYGEALTCCEQAGETAGAATALHGIAVACFRTGRYREALDTATDALARYQEMGDQVGAGEALKIMALSHLQLGDYPQAINHLHRALVMHRASGDRTNEGRSLNNLGFLHYRIGHDDEALRYFEEGRAIAHKLGNRAGEAVALINLAHLDARHGRVKEALAGHHEAVQLCTDIGYRVGQAEALRGLGVALRRLGRLADAFKYLNQALVLSQDLHDPDMEAGALDDLGRTLRAAGRLPDALRRHTEAHSIATASGDPYAQARALSGQAVVLEAAGQAAAAGDYRARAEALYDRIGVPPHARD